MAIIQGGEGWLFLTDGSNDTLAYSTGERSIDDNVVRSWHRLLELREAWLARRDVAFYAFIAPNKEVAYADRLPADAGSISEDRPVRLIERRLAQSSTVSLEYPLDELIEARAIRETYPSHDSHWNGWGAYVFYRSAMDLIAKDFPNVRILEETDVEFKDHLAMSDLGSKLDPPTKAITIRARLPSPRFRVTFDNKVLNNGHVTATEWTTPAVGPKVMFFHDSFHGWTLPLFAESFSATVSAHNYRLDFDLVERERPDIVVVEITERFLVKAPADADGVTTEQIRLAKEAGLVDPEDARPDYRPQTPVR